MNILNERDDGLVSVYNRLIEERTNPSKEPFVDSDNIKKQVHLTREEVEALLAKK